MTTICNMPRGISDSTYKFISSLDQREGFDFSTENKAGISLHGSYLDWQRRCFVSHKTSFEKVFGLEGTTCKWRVLEVVQEAHRFIQSLTQYQGSPKKFGIVHLKLHIILQQDGLFLSFLKYLDHFLYNTSSATHPKRS